MRAILSLLLVATAALGQTPSLSLSAPAVRAGTSATVAVTLSGAAGQNLAAIEWAATLPAGSAVQIGAASSAAKKTLKCGTNAAGLLTCIVYGINANALADGVLATISVPTTAPNPFTASNAQGPTITPTTVAGANLAGNGVALSGSAVTLTLLSPCDLNGDGTTDALDADAAITQIVTGVGSLPSISGGTSLTLVDVQRIVNGAVNGSCLTGQ